MTDLDLSALMDAYPPGVDWSTVDYPWSTVYSSPLACVKRGMAYLLATYPERLYIVDAETLDLRRCDTCPLAQVAGEFFTGTTEYQTRRWPWLDAHGFGILPEGAYWPDGVESWMAEATRLWRLAFRVLQSTRDGA